jgi:hypothetical protein
MTEPRRQSLIVRVGWSGQKLHYAYTDAHEQPRLRGEMFQGCVPCNGRGFARLTVVANGVNVDEALTRLPAGAEDRLCRSCFVRS